MRRSFWRPLLAALTISPCLSMVGGTAAAQVLTLPQALYEFGLVEPPKATVPDANAKTSPADILRAERERALARLAHAASIPGRRAPSLTAPAFGRRLAARAEEARR